MATHDYSIANGTGAAFRSDLNNALAAIVSNNSSATAPATTYAYMWWPDTTTGLLKIRNAANNAWVVVGTLASANLGLIPAGTGSIVNADVNASAGITAGKLSFTQAGTGATARTIDSKLKDVVSVKDFGAVGDGTTNDTAAVQAAVNAVGTNGAVYFPPGTYSVTSLTSANNVLLCGNGASFTGGYSRKIAQIGSISGDGQRQYDFIGCAIRNFTGTFAFINDADHQPTGLQSVSHLNSNTIQVDYKKNCQKVGTFLACPDETLAAYGVSSGASVGLSASYIKTAAPLGFYVSAAGVVTTTPIWTGSITATVAGDTITVTHPEVADQEDTVIVSSAGTSLQLRAYASWNINTIYIRAMDELNGYVYYNGSSWVWDNTSSSNVAAPTIAWQSGTNRIRITHADAGDYYGLSLTPHQNGVINPVVGTAASNYFEVAFYDAAGSQVTTQGTSMKFWYRRSFQVHSKLPAGALFSVRRGPALVPAANYVNVPGHNFWIMGAMENNT